MDELEIIQHGRMDGLTLFVDTLEYRTPHVHPEWELIWVLDQPLHVIGDGGELRLLPGELVLFPPDDPHELRGEPRSTFLCLQAAPRWLPGTEGLRPEERVVGRVLPLSEQAVLKQRLWATAQAYFVAADRYALYCLGQSCLLLHTLLTALPCRTMTPEELAGQHRRNARLKRLIRYVDEHYMHTVRLQDFAREEGCSVSYLSHFIKDSMNQTFREYVESVRFNEARKRIAAGADRMLDVCVESGFSDYRYFSRAFRERYGVTPDEFSRQEARRPAEQAPTHRSRHSVERLYTPAESLVLLERFAPLKTE